MKERICELPFGNRQLSIDLPHSAIVNFLTPAASGVVGNQKVVAQAALQYPIGSSCLREIVSPGQSVAVITSDNTRPCPSDLLLPLVIEELRAGGVSVDDIIVVVALGLHRPLSRVELCDLVGQEVFDAVTVINHDPNDTVFVGTTQSGTPVELFRRVVDADVRVGLGNIEFHYFAGYSGGAKSILPGCASESTVSANHSLMIEPGSKVGALEGNPVRIDIEEGVGKVGLEFIFNAIVDNDHRLVAAVAGDATLAHRHGCRVMAQRSAVTVTKKADIVIVSAGGYPSDLNLYQAQKALENAAGVVRDGGAIIWVAECGEGFGSATFEEWIRQAGSPEQVLRRIKQKFVLGGHKAAAIAAVSLRAQIYLISAFGSNLENVCGVIAHANAETALQEALVCVQSSTPSITVMPHGACTFPLPEAVHGAAV